MASMTARGFFCLLLTSMISTACSDGGEGTNSTDAGGSAGTSGSSGQSGAAGASAGTGGAPAAGAAGAAGTPTAGAAGSAGATDEGPQSEGLVFERWGARARGTGLRVRRSGRALWIGSRPLADTETNAMRGGLERLDLDTGEVRVFEKELPTFQGDNDDAAGPMPTADAIDDGDRTLVVGRGGLLVRKGSEFTTIDLGASPVAMELDRAGGRKNLWVATSKALLKIDADTLVTQVTIELAEDTGKVAHMASDPADGTLYAVARSDKTGLTRAVRIDPDGVITSFTPGEDGVDLGMLGEVVFSKKAGGALFTLATWQSKAGGIVRWDGKTAPTRLVTEGQLAKASRGGYGAFGPSVLALDDEAGILIIGGQIAATGNATLIGGGLVWMDLASGKLAGLSSGRNELIGDHIDSVAYDPKTLRAHVLVRQPCDHTKLGNRGLVSVSFKTGKQPRYERPILSGVRTVTRVGDRTLVGLRDDASGLSCYGYPVQTGLYELRSNHAGEQVRLGTTSPDEATIRADAGPTAVAVDGDRMAIGTWRDGGLIGDPGNATFFNPTSYGPSLWTLDMAWQDSALWVTGRSSHNAGDPAEWDKLGPFGAARLEVDAGGKITGATSYVRASKNPGPITGLPSNEVTAAVPLHGGATLLACATERVTANGLDREAREVYTIDGKPQRGGLALVKDKIIDVIGEPGAVPDPRAASLSFDGSSVLVLDATRGALRMDVTTHALTQQPLPLQPAAGAVPQSLWLGRYSALAATYDRGAVVQLAGRAVLIEDVGHAWRAAGRSDTEVLVGTDEGLVVVHTKESAIDKEPAPGQAVLPTFVLVVPEGEDEPTEQCIEAGQPCNPDDSQCCSGLTCSNSGFSPTCH